MGDYHRVDYVFFDQKVFISEEGSLICFVDYRPKRIGSREELIKR